MPKANQLGKDLRLAKAESFQKVFKNAIRFRHLGISVLVCRNNLTFSRIGIIIPKKQIPRAVDRNRIKRIIREHFRLQRDDIPCHLDMVFVAYATVLNLSHEEINACLHFLWKKLAVFCRKA